MSFKILVLEGSPSRRNNIANYKVISVENGKTGVELANRRSPKSSKINYG